MLQLQVGAFVLAGNGGAGCSWLAGGLLLVFLLVLGMYLNTRTGLSLVALRDSDHISLARGIYRIKTHLFDFVFASGVALLTGALYLMFFRVADTALFSFSFAILALSMIFIGGLGQTWEPTAGAVAAKLIDRQLVDLGPWRQIIIRIGTITVLIIRRRGISGLTVSVVEGG